MVRFFVPAAVIAGMLALLQPALAEPVVAAAVDRVPASTPAAQQPLPPAPTPPQPDAPVQATTGYLKNMIPVGFGWG